MITPIRIVVAAALIVATGLLTTIGHAQSVAQSAPQPGDWQILRADPEINSGLIVIAVGRHIQSNCDEISARMVQAFVFAQGLVGRAADLGVSRSVVDDFLDDRTEQQHYRQVMRDWFAARGVDHGDDAAVCRVGRDEITAGSQIGRLLRRG